MTPLRICHLSIGLMISSGSSQEIQYKMKYSDIKAHSAACILPIG